MTSMRILFPFLLASVFAAIACTNPGSVEGFKHPGYGGLTRAAYELDCPADKLTIHDLGDGTMGVEGCGRKAIYKLAMGAGWVNNSGFDDPREAKAKK